MNKLWRAIRNYAVLFFTLTGLIILIIFGETAFIPAMGVLCFGFLLFFFSVFKEVSYNENARKYGPFDWSEAVRKMKNGCFVTRPGEAQCWFSDRDGTIITAQYEDPRIILAATINFGMVEAEDWSIVKEEYIKWPKNI
jgi:hypothetical protein